MVRRRPHDTGCIHDFGGWIVLFVNEVQASPITYSLTSTATGTLGASSFTNAPLTVTLTGDTSNVMAGPVPFTDVLVNPGSATVSVSGHATLRRSPRQSKVTLTRNESARHTWEPEPHDADVHAQADSLTNGFSKNRSNLKAALSLHFAHYNFADAT